MAGKLGQAERDLHGVIAAIATAVDPSGEPDCARSIALARFLLANGCDGLNVLGTTGEATSFSLDQRRRVMNAYAESGLPLTRMMVGTGAAALADAITLTRHAAELGFAGALVLPPLLQGGIGRWPCRGHRGHSLGNRGATHSALPLSFSGTIGTAVARGSRPPALAELRRPYRRAERFLGRHGLCP
jgi:hypothetical protein